MKKTRAILIVLLFLCTMSVQADVVLPLQNSSFEDDVTDTTQYYLDTGSTYPAGWTTAGDGETGAVGEDHSNIINTPAGSAWGVLSNVNAPNTVSLGQAIGSSATLSGKKLIIRYLVAREISGDPSVLHKIKLVEGTTTTYDGTVLAENYYTRSLPSTTAYNEVEVELTPAGGTPATYPVLWLVYEDMLTHHGSLLIDTISVREFRAGQAVNVSPTDGAIDVTIDATPTLEWTAGDDPSSLIQGYLVYMGKSAIDDVVNGIQTAGPTYQHGVDLDVDATYQWRIDTWLGGSTTDPNNIVVGDVWTFDTEQTLPIIDTQPQDVLGANPGFDVEITVEATDPQNGTLTYQWKYDPNEVVTGDEVTLNDGDRGGRISGATAATLTIEDVEASDTGHYYCDVTNTVTSDMAQLTVGRMIAHYAFDSNANDSSYRANHGTWSGTETYDTTTQMVGTGAAVFDGASFVDLGTAGAPNSDVDGITKGSISVWYKTTDTAEVAIAGSFNSIGSLGFQILLNGAGDTGRFTVYIRDNNGANYNVSIYLPEGEVIGDGQWHHFAMTWGSTWIAYLDGVRYAIYGSTGNVSSLVPWEYSMDIGARQNRATVDMYLTGSIDDYRLYDYNLNGIEIARLYTDVVTDAEVCAERPELDFNNDCIVNLADFALMATGWLDCGLLPSIACD